MQQAKMGVAFYPMIDTERSFPGRAAEFDVAINQLSDGAVVVNNGSGACTEIMHPVNGHTGNTNLAAAIGDATIEMDAGSTLAKNDVFDDGAGNLYKVITVTGDVIGVTPALTAAIALNTDLDATGNTGSYTFECQVNAANLVSVEVFHPSLGNVPMTWEIVEKTTQDGIVEQETQYQDVSAKLVSMGASTVMKGVI